jgi:alpha/beta superfamily hydrolase
VSSDVTTLLTYFGPAESPLFGAVSTPRDRRVRGGVVLCPPLGKEQCDSTRGQKLLAERLAAQGLLVLRFDYLHTGESAGAQDSPDAADGWLRSITLAVGFVREAGIDQIALVGLRAGALLACQQLDVLGPLAALVLWDPVINGRHYVRGQTALHNMSVGAVDAADERVHLVGASLHSAAAARLSKMRVTSEVMSVVGPPAALCGVRDTELQNPVIEALKEQGAGVFSIGDPTLFIASVTVYFELPVRAVETISNWLDSAFRNSTVSVALSERPRITLSTVGGYDVEKSISILSDGTVVWQTAPANSIHGTDKLLMAYSTANDIRTGPARLWVEAGDIVAGRNGRTIRFDRPGVGESGHVDESGDFAPLYTPESVEQARAVFDFAAPGPERIVHAGLCSGSWLAAHGGCWPEQSHVVMVNPLMWRLKARTFDTAMAIASGAAPVATGDSGIAATKSARLQATLRGRLGPALRKYMPYSVVGVLGALGVVQAPQLLLTELANQGLRPDVLFSPWDYERFKVNRGPKAVRKIKPALQPHISVTSTGDHPGLHWQVRAAVIDLSLSALHASGDEQKADRV